MVLLTYYTPPWNSLAAFYLPQPFSGATFLIKYLPSANTLQNNLLVPFTNGNSVTVPIQTDANNYEKLLWNAYIFREGERRVIAAANRIGSGNDWAASLQGSDNACLADGDALLFHGLVDAGTICIIHLRGRRGGGWERKGDGREGKGWEGGGEEGRSEREEEGVRERGWRKGVRGREGEEGVRRTERGVRGRGGWEVNREREKYEYMDTIPCQTHQWDKLLCLPAPVLQLPTSTL